MTSRLGRLLGLDRRSRVRTPTILQMELTECGPAALAIILAYFGRRVSLEELRVACGVSRDGSKASSIVRAARRYGLDAKGQRLELDEVLAGPFPVIVHWRFNHFLVLEGVSDTGVFLNDPATGPRRVSREEFDRSFTGVGLRFAPGPDFRPGGASAGLLAQLGHRLAGCHVGIGIIAWLSLMLVIPGLVLPGATKAFVDDILVKRFEGWLSPLLVGLAVMFVLQIALSAVQQMALVRLELKLALEESARFTWHVLRLPVEFFNQRFAGDLANRIDSNDRVARLLARDCGQAAATCCTAAFLGIVMLFYDPTLAAIAIGGAALNVGLLTLMQRVLQDIVLRLQTEMGKLYAVSVVGLQSIETLKATGTERDFFAKWTGHHARAMNSEQKLAIYQQASNLVPPLVSSLTSAAVLGVGAVQVVGGTLSVGELVAFQSLVLSFSAPIALMVGTAAKVQQASADITRLDDVLQYRRDWRFSEEPAPVETFAAGQLSLKGVTFGYNPLEPPLLDDVSIEVSPGQWVALVGDSGSGKSTLGKLITGLYTPRSGEIRIDGHTLAEWGRDRLAHIVSSVDQDICLFHGTLRDNITLWDETVTHRTLLAAVHDAGLGDVVKHLTGDIDGVIEEGGRNLNGGQRQRVEIARALVQEPAVLVLDEATSGLDAESEDRILSAVRRRGMTCVLIAHRLSTIRDCDEIIVLERGRIVERGTHDGMVAAGGPYARLISAEAEA
jgi:NHLM bacteriocin system ABC transporter peptidase/ATP-binding protein